MRWGKSNQVAPYSPDETGVGGTPPELVREPESVATIAAAKKVGLSSLVVIAVLCGRSEHLFDRRNQTGSVFKSMERIESSRFNQTFKSCFVDVRNSNTEIKCVLERPILFTIGYRLTHRRRRNIFAGVEPKPDMTAISNMLL